LRRELFFVNISHIGDINQLVFFGYHIINETDDFWLFQCFDGEEQIVQKARPLLLVNDVNDANAIGAFEGFVFMQMDG